MPGHSWGDDKFPLAINGNGKYNGTRKHPLCHRWHHMFSKCYNPNTGGYSDYGAKGIRVYEGWKDFKLYLSDVGEPPGLGFYLDRIDPFGHYVPGNVRWVTPSDSSRNTRPWGTIQYKGVKRNNKGYMAAVSVKGRRVHLGTYPTPEHAAVAYNSACIALGLITQLNKIYYTEDVYAKSSLE